MITNTEITIYHKYTDPSTRLDAYSRRLGVHALWEGRRAASVESGGMKEDDSVTVYIPFANAPELLIAPGDLIVRGRCTREISDDFPVRELQKQFIVRTVTSVDLKDYGCPALWHYEIGGA